MKIAPVFALLTFVLVAAATHGQPAPQVPLDSSTIPQFAQPLPKLTTIAGNRPLTLRMCEFRANVLPPDAVPNDRGTAVWGYLPDPTGTSSCAQLIASSAGANGGLDTYIGPVIVNERGTPTRVTYINDLGTTTTTSVLAVRNSIDQTIHWADPHGDSSDCTHEMRVPPFGSNCAQNYAGAFPAVPHLHGGEVPAEIDGGPDSWFTSDGLDHGAKYYSPGIDGNRVTFNYPNRQAAAPI